MQNILESPSNKKLKCMKLRPYGKIGVRETKDTQNMMLNLYN